MVAATAVACTRPLLHRHCITLNTGKCIPVGVALPPSRLLTRTISDGKIYRNTFECYHWIEQVPFYSLQSEDSYGLPANIDSELFAFISVSRLHRHFSNQILQQNTTAKELQITKSDPLNSYNRCQLPYYSFAFTADMSSVKVQSLCWSE